MIKNVYLRLTISEEEDKHWDHNQFVLGACVRKQRTTCSLLSHTLALGPCLSLSPFLCVFDAYDHQVKPIYLYA